MNRRYWFLTTCVYADGDAINAMVDASHDITRGTFLRTVERGELAEIELALGYARARCRDGSLTMARDRHVSYARSRYEDRPCVYFTWSAIEYVFVAPD